MTTLKTYEALFIIRPDLEDEENQTIANEIETLVKDNGGAVVRSEIWGKRRLAYEVKGFNEGCYVLLRFDAPGECIAKLQAYFRLSEKVIRNLVVHFDPHALRAEALQEKQNQEEAARAAERERTRTSSDDDDDEDEAPRRSRAHAHARD